MSKGSAPRKPLYWVGSSLEDLKQFPGDVQDVMGHALDIAQQGKKHIDAKPLTGFGGASVLEIVDDFDGDTYRAVYTVKFASGIYVLHSFQKKSKKGAKTPKSDVDLIMGRLKTAKADHEKRTQAAKKR